MNTFPEKIQTLKQSIETISDIDGVKNEGAMKRRELKEKIGIVKEKIAPTDSAVEEATKRYKELQVCYL